jgi:hypothetical protein
MKKNRINGASGFFDMSELQRDRGHGFGTGMRYRF